MNEKLIQAPLKDRMIVYVGVAMGTFRRPLAFATRRGGGLPLFKQLQSGTRPSRMRNNRGTVGTDAGMEW